MKTKCLFTLSMIIIACSFIACDKNDNKEETRNVGNMKAVSFSADTKTSFSKTFTLYATDLMPNFDSTKQVIKKIEVVSSEAKVSKLPISSLIGGIEISSKDIEPYKSNDYILVQYFGQVSYVATQENNQFKQFMQEVMNKVAVDRAVDITIKGYNGSDSIALQDAQMTFITDMNIRLEDK